MIILSMDVKGHVGRVISLYVNRDLADLECVPDDKVRGVFRFKATYVGGDVQYFRTRHAPPDKVQFADLEEIRPTSWPPKPSA